MYQIYEFLFKKGGPVMYPIIIGSIIALALFLERVWALRRDKILPEALRRRLRVLVKEGKLSEAEVLCQEHASPMAVVSMCAIRHAGKEKAFIREEINDVGRREISHLERNVEFLGTIAAAEPLMGLLGTVTGLIGAFQGVETHAAKGQGVNPGILASGIWEALITTAAGLVIAIPAYVGYRYLQGKVNTVVVDLEESALSLADAVACDAGAVDMEKPSFSSAKKRSKKSEAKKSEAKKAKKAPEDSDDDDDDGEE